MKAKRIEGVPEQYKGFFHDTESQKDFVESKLAIQKFEILKERFFSINHWKDHCGRNSADFKLYDSLGYPIDRHPRKGDFIRIDIPGPGDFKTKGYDWVEIVKMENRFYKDEELESYLMTCRPSKEPIVGNAQIAHFYSPDSTSTFIIVRGENFIRFGIYGRNEIPNYSGVGFFAKVRHFIISLFAFAKLTKAEWRCLIDGLLDI